MLERTFRTLPTRPERFRVRIENHAALRQHLPQPSCGFDLQLLRSPTDITGVNAKAALWLAICNPLEQFGPVRYHRKERRRFGAHQAANPDGHRTAGIDNRFSFSPRQDFRDREIGWFIEHQADGGVGIVVNQNNYAVGEIRIVRFRCGHRVPVESCCALEAAANKTFAANDERKPTMLRWH
jgi:hypothetical protein